MAQGGATSLVVLWWEWPSEHWDDLWMGTSMNFLHTPISGLIDNSISSKEEQITATIFVDELIVLES